MTSMRDEGIYYVNRKVNDDCLRDKGNLEKWLHEILALIF